MSNNVSWFPPPLIRQKAFYPGQVGVPGSDTTLGLRTDSNGVVFYVDPNHGAASDSNDGTDPENPLLTIAQANTNARSYRNDTIAVMGNSAWQYGPGTPRGTAIAEEVAITKHGVKLVGVFPSSSVGVPWESQTIGTPCITVNAIDVTIEGFAFVGGAAGGIAIYAEWDGATLWGENVTVRHCVFDDDIDTGIQLEYSWFCDIHDNLFQECDAYGIHAAVGGSGIAYCKIHHNKFLDCATAAIALLGGCDNNDVYSNVIFNTDAQNGAAATNEGIDTTGGTTNSVYDNTISCLLPVPANGDYNDLNTAAATDAWANNHLMNGPSVTNPT